jgi:sensor histidine kinase YesM
MVDGKKTKQMTVALSALLRYSLNYTESNFATPEEEAKIIETYLEIEQIRFGENLQYEISLSPAAKAYPVPRFLLQPLVENCIRHAFTEPATINFIKVNIYRAGDETVITVHDNGTPFPAEFIPGYGLKNVTDKLQLLLPGRHQFEMTNTPQKQVRITMKALTRTHEQLP